MPSGLNNKSCMVLSLARSFRNAKPKGQQNRDYQHGGLNYMHIGGLSVLIRLDDFLLKNGINIGFAVKLRKRVEIFRPAKGQHKRDDDQKLQGNGPGKNPARSAHIRQSFTINAGDHVKYQRQSNNDDPKRSHRLWSQGTDQLVIN